MAANRLLTPSFETDSNSDGLADNWEMERTTAAAQTTTLSADAPYHGLVSQRIQFYSLADVGKACSITQTSAAGTFAPGESATWSFYIKGAVAGVTVTGVLQAVTAAGGYISESATSSLTLSTTWTRYSVTTPSLPATTSRCKVLVYFAAIDAGDTIGIYLDAAKLEKSSVASAYGGSRAAMQVVLL